MKFSNSNWKPHEQAAQITQPDCVNQPGPLDRSPTELEGSLGLIKSCGRLRTEEFRFSIILSRVIESLRQSFQTKSPKISDHSLNKSTVRHCYRDVGFDLPQAALESLALEPRRDIVSRESIDKSARKGCTPVDHDTLSHS